MDLPNDSFVKQDYHYYVTNMVGWVVREDLFEALEEHKKEFGNNTIQPMALIYKVPVPIDSHYDILFYIPEVPDVEFIDYVGYNKKGLKAAAKARLKLQGVE